MQNRWIGRILRVATALALSTVLFAQTSTRPEAAKSTPDLSGVWQQAPGRGQLRLTEEEPPFQMWAREIYKVNRGGAYNSDGSGVNGLDPEMYCLPDGVPRIYTTPTPIEIVQVPGRLYMLFQSLQNPLPRYIYTDGRGHPDGFPLTFMGHSIGHWDGDTLVVDTVGLDELTWMDTAGTPHSDALHVVERLRRVAQDTLEVNLQFEDPKAFTRPWTAKKVFKLYPDWQMVPGLTCEDRFRADFEKKSLRDKKEWIERPR